jgi:hypothetical protein
MFQHRVPSHGWRPLSVQIADDRPHMGRTGLAFLGLHEGAPVFIVVVVVVVVVTSRRKTKEEVLEGEVGAQGPEEGDSQKQAECL